MPSAQSDSPRSPRARLVLLLTYACLVLVALPRFNRNQRFVEAPPRDDVQYRLYVQFFRGEVDADTLRPASSWRPLVPFVASWLPFEPMTALSLTNLFFLGLGLALLDRTLDRLGVRDRHRQLGGLIYAVSFPVFYYATIGYVDPGLIGLLGLGAYLAARGHFVRLFPVLALATLAKEGSLVLVPVAMTAALLVPAQGPKKVATIGAVLLFPILWWAVIQLVRTYAPGAASDAFWVPNWEVFLQNAARPRAWLSALLTAGVPGFLLIALRREVAHAVRDRPRELAPLLVGSLAAIGSWAYAFATASVDGRGLWTMYPFVLPVLMLALDKRPARRTRPEGVPTSDPST